MKEEEDELRELIAELLEVDASTARFQAFFKREIESAHPDRRPSSVNLVDYLALRSHDISEVQNRLSRLGLSSLGRSESHTRASLLAVLKILTRLTGQTEPNLEKPIVSSLDEGRKLLRGNAEHLFGSAPRSRSTRIMVTLPGEAADDYRMVRDLVEGGMNCARINCAHDNPSTWRKLAGNVRAAARELQHDCGILMDLGGPKLRTGRFAKGPAVITWKVGRDDRGHLIQPARVALCANPLSQSLPGADAVIPLGSPLPSSLGRGQEIRFHDLRGRERVLVVRDNDGESGRVFATAEQKAYLAPGTKLTWKEKGKSASESVADFSGGPNRIALKAGDFLILTDESELGRPAVIDEQGRILSHARVPCTLPEIFPHLKPGERIKFDDGKITGVIREIEDDTVLVEITHPLNASTRLGEDKGINFPDSTIPVSGMVEKDLVDLDTVVEIADLVGLSFVKEANDIRQLREELEKRNALDLGIILKIETRRGFENLPSLLLAGLSSARLGVMIARGDLGVECGWERMAELQEEILWLCEAAHIPVIWATQVLESLAKTGLPARGEITDAAMSQRAECVMLNKGPHILETVRMLNEILMRMDRHQLKKTPMLRSLSVSDLVPEKES